LYKAMGGGWQAARREPVLDERTREVMINRSNWNGLLDAPLPPPESAAQGTSSR
jgi:outer membrane protein, multidrug efflux system